MTKKEIIKKLNSESEVYMELVSYTDDERCSYGDVTDELAYEILKGYKYDERTQMFERKNGKGFKVFAFEPSTYKGKWLYKDRKGAK